MKILYHMTAPEPLLKGSDAVFQEVDVLRRHFGGDVINLYPLRRPSRWFPRALYGLSVRGELRARDQAVDLHHVYHADYRPFPVLRSLRKPILYSVVAGLRGQSRPSADALRLAKWIVVSNERDQAILKSWGCEGSRLIRPGLEVSGFTHTPAPGKGPFVLFVGSAPWVRSQFAQKGIDVLLATARRIPNLRVVLLWRGILREELDRRIRRFGVGAQVEVIEKRANVNEVLARCHAAVVLASTSRIVKAYPHSLLESLAAGKPVLVSESIAMADYVRDKECGAVVQAVRAAEFQATLERFMNDYDRYLSNARRTGAQDFAIENMIRGYGELYSAAASR